jgi:drug/metabolite transporter (DMT)-like permease
MSKLTKGYLIAIVGTTIWSATAIFIRYLTETHAMPPLVLAFWRDLLVSVVLTMVFAVTARSLLRVERRHLGFLLFYGFVLSIFNGLWTVSVALNGAAVSTVLAYSSAAFTAIASWRLFGERLDWIKILAVASSIIGCAFVSGAYDPGAWRINPLGIVTGLLAGVAFAGYSLMGKASSQRDINPWTTVLYIFATAAMLLLVYNFALAPLTGALNIASPNLLWLGPSLTGWGAMALLVLGPTIGGYGLYTVSLTYLPASVANLIATLEPSMTAAQAYLFLHETFTGPQLIGSALIIAGVIILRIGEGRVPVAAPA